MGEAAHAAGDVAYLVDVVVILLAAVVAVLLLHRLRFATVFGYLAAGAAIGPHALALVDDVESTRRLAELGVVFLLFTVGLDLPYERLRVMRAGAFGLGVAQIGLTALAIWAVVFLAGVPFDGAVVIGTALALSSTAVVLQLLTERRQLVSHAGRAAFAVLLVQDLAVGPLLVLVLAFGDAETWLPAALGLAAVKIVAALALIMLLGRWVLRPLFRPVAALRNADIFAALTLLVLLCTGLATHLAGLSMAFGAFLAGMLLADTVYRHQVAAVVQPFRGLLLGLFFITVGMSVDLAFVAAHWGELAVTVGLLLAVKAILLAGAALAFGQPASRAIHLGLLLCQGGEFAFVLLGAAAVSGVLPERLVQVLIAGVILTMVATPALAWLGRVVERRIEQAGSDGVDRLDDEERGQSDHAVIVGYGRVGETIARRLQAEGVGFVAIDMDPERIAVARRQGLPVFYGDATKPEVLDALGVARARAVIVAMDDAQVALQLVTLLRYVFPELRIVARARDDAHAEALRGAGASEVVPEIFDAAARLAGSVLPRTKPGPEPAEG